MTTDEIRTALILGSVLGGSASGVRYDNTQSGLSAATVQGAIDALAADRLTVKTVMDAVAVAGTQYYLGTQSAVSLVLPSDARVGQQISVVFYSGANAATLSITGTVLPVSYTPSANSRSEINALWDGSYWAVVANEQAVAA